MLSNPSLEVLGVNWSFKLISKSASFDVIETSSINRGCCGGPLIKIIKGLEYTIVPSEK